MQSCLVGPRSMVRGRRSFASSINSEARRFLLGETRQEVGGRGRVAPVIGSCVRGACEPGVRRKGIVGRRQPEAPSIGEVGGGAARGAAGGALIGAIVHSGHGAGKGAAIGAGLGMLHGGVRKGQKRDDLYRYYYDQCMRGNTR